MNNHDGNQLDSDDLLAKSLAAINAELVPEGPDAQTNADLLAALRKAASKGRASRSMVNPIGLLQRALAMTFTQKIFATVAFTLAGMLLWFMFTMFSSVGYAEVAATLRSVHSMTCTAVVTGMANGKPTTMQMMFLDANHVREELPGSIVFISDNAAHRFLTLNPTEKTATVINFDLVGGEKNPQQDLDFVDQFHQIANQKGDVIGEQQIDGVTAKGFRVTQGSTLTTVWADAKSGALLRVEMTMPMGSTTAHVVLSDIVVDAKLDESLFSLEPPAGYTLKTQNESVNLNLDDNVVTVLKAYSAENQGNFPPRINDMSVLSKLIQIDANGQPTADSTKLGSAVGALFGLLFPQEKGKDYDYIPTVHLGDAGSIVFWHHDKDTGKLMAVFGDLSIKEVTADQLPPPVKDTEPTTIPAAN